MFGTIALSFNYDSTESENEENPAEEKRDVRTETNQNTTDAVLTQYHHCINHKNNEDNRLYLKNLRDATNILELPEEQFIKTFRINKEVFSNLLDEITPHLKVTYRITHIPAPIKLATFLAFIATGGQNEYKTAMSKSQMSKIICEMLDIFKEHLWAKWVQLQRSQEEENLTKDYFYNTTGIPGVVGCVGNTHIPIKTPEKQVKHLYNNSEGFSSLNVMVICDHNMVITHVDSSQPGSYADCYVWQESYAEYYFNTHYLNGKHKTWLLGDSAYKLQPYLLTPYRNPVKDYQKLFNKKHGKICNVIKECFKVLKNRFSCLITPTGLQYIPEKAVKIVITCCILHNICIKYKSKWAAANIILEELDNLEDESDTTETYQECSVSNSIRDEIASDLPYWVPPLETSHQQHCPHNNKDIRLHLKNLRDATNVLELPEERFNRTFRINKQVFSMLLEEIIQKLRVTYRCTHMPAPIKLATFLTFIATGGQKASEGNGFASKSQVSKVICEMLDIFEEHLYPKWIKLEQNDESENMTKEYFYKSTGIPGIVGCVDNTHIQIKTPAKDIKHLYKNSKGSSSLNAMMICDHNMVITFVDARQPGCYHNDYVWDQSSADYYLRTNYLKGKINTWVIGDSSYKLLPYMMTPYRTPTEPHRQLFNEKLCEARNIIKRCINVLKTRFSSLNTPLGLQYTPEKAVKIVTSCCILHNICMAYNNSWQPSNNTLEDIDNEAEIDTAEVSDEECALSNFIRDEIAGNIYCSKTNSYVS